MNKGKYRFSLSSLAQATWYLERHRVDPRSQAWRLSHLIPERRNEAFTTSADSVGRRMSDIETKLKNILYEFDINPTPAAGAVVLSAATGLRMNEVLQITRDHIPFIRDMQPVPGIRYKKKRGPVALRIFYIPSILTPERFDKLSSLTKRVSRQSITRFLRKRGLPGGLQHLRAYTATRLLQMGLTRNQVRLFMRHRSSTTLDNYNARADLADIIRRGLTAAAPTVA